MEDKNLTTEQKLLAAVTHGSAMTMGIGIVAAIIVYTTQRDKNRYVAFQALQAAVYQVISMVLIVGGWILWTVFYMASLFPLIRYAEANPDGPLPASFWIGMGSMFIPMLFMVVVGIYGLIGAIQTWQGKHFKYWILGKKLEESGLWKEGEENV